MGLYPSRLDEQIPIRLALGIPLGHRSKTYVVDPTNGSDDNDGRSFEKPLASLEAAIALCTSGQHDLILLVAGATGNTLAAAVTWNLSYTHLVGMCAPSKAGQRARVFQAAALTGASPLIAHSGTGCIWKNVYIFQGVADNTSLVNVALTGQRNYFENVHFAGGGHATQAIATGASLVIGTAGSENFFKGCTFGVDTANASTGLAAVSFTNATLANMPARNVFEDCLFTLYAAGGTPAGVRFVQFATDGAFDRYTEFRKCRFYNFATAMTSAFVFAANQDPANKRVLLIDCELLGANDWDSGNTGMIYLNSTTRTGGGNAGILLASNAT